jgi:hypothetical protein
MQRAAARLGLTGRACSVDPLACGRQGPRDAATPETSEQTISCKEDWRVLLPRTNALYGESKEATTGIEPV